jgi:TctA family transporter
MSDVFAALGIGLHTLFSWPNILIPVLGTVLAMVVSFLPGIGAASLAAVMVVVTLGWAPEQVLLLFGALTGGATFMGSVTAILFGIPGNAASSVTLIDGYPMAQAGRARSALAAAATASALGSIFGVLVLIALLPVIRPVLLQIGPLERAALAIWGLATIISVIKGSALRALAVSGLGLVLAMVGSDPATSQPRWSFGQIALSEGLRPEVMLLGLFTLSEVLSWRGRQGLRPALRAGQSGDSAAAGVLAVWRHRALVLRAGVIGTVIGMIPGVGGTVAGFVAYGQTVQTARGDRSGFGKGDVRGVIGPEAAVDAKDGGSLLPVLALGLPGSEGGVFLLTVLAIHGFVPGAAMLGPDLGLSFTLILALLMSNLLTSVLGLALVPALARLTRLPIERIALPVLVVGLVTVVQLNGFIADLYVAVGFAMLGYLFRRLDWPRVPFVIAFVLGPSLETNLTLVDQLHAVGRLELGARPLALAIFGLTLVSLVWMLLSARTPQAAPRRAPGHPADRAAAVVLGLGVAVLALVAMTGGIAYSGYARAICLATLAVLVAVALIRPLIADPAEPLVPRAHRLPLALLGAFPVATVCIGLPGATGLLVLLWLAPWARGRRDRLIAPVLATLACAAVALYLDRVAVLDLPTPLVFALPVGTR